MVSTKTLYNYIDLGLIPIKNTDLSMKLRRNTKSTRIRKHKKKLGKSIIDEAVIDELHAIRNIFSTKFSQVFKTITGDNGSEFANLASIETTTATQVYFTHPYSSFQKGTNERHNGLIRRFIPKGKCICDFSNSDIAFIEDWMNTLPRRILNYKTPEELFKTQLDSIYAT